MASNEDKHLTMPEVVTIAQVEALAVECRNLVAAGHMLRIDASAVKRIDTAGLQLVVALVAEVKRRQRAFEWLGRSEAFLAAARCLGLEQHLGDAAVRGNV